MLTRPPTFGPTQTAGNAARRADRDPTSPAADADPSTLPTPPDPVSPGLDPAPAPPGGNGDALLDNPRPRVQAQRQRLGPSARIAGVDLGGTNLNAGVVAADEGEILGRAHRRTFPEGEDASPDGVIERIAAAVRAACNEAGVEPEELAGVGVGAPGVTDIASGLVRDSPNLRWDRVELGPELSRRLAGVETRIDNDVNAAVLGERAFGAARGVDDLIGVWVGTGIGAGVILGGRLIRGPHGSAGEIGRTVLVPNAPLGLQLTEEVASRHAVGWRLREMIRRNHASALLDLAGGDADAITPKHIARAYAEGDALTVRVIDEAATLVGVAIANAVAITGATTVVLGGGLTEAIGETFVGAVDHAVRAHTLPGIADYIDVRMTALRDRAGVLGAAALISDDPTG